MTESTTATIRSATRVFATRPADAARGHDTGARTTVALGVVLFLTMLPVTMMVPVIRELVADRFGVGSLHTHLFMAINMAGAIVTAPFTARLADRAFSRRAVLLASLLLNALTLALMPVVPSFYVFMGLRFVEGACHVLGVSTIMAAASDLAPADRRGRRMGCIGAALTLGTACGAPLGGWIGGHAPGAVFVAGVGSIMIAAAVAARFAVAGESRTRAACLADAARLLHVRRALLIPYGFSFIDRFCVGVFVSTFVLFLTEVHGITPAYRGILLSLFLFPFALLCYPAGRLADHAGQARLMIYGSAGFGVAFAGYGLLPAAWMPLLMAASGVFSALMFAPNLAMCADLAPPGRRAAAYAGFNVAGSLGFFCGPLSGGLAYAFFIQQTTAAHAYALVLAFAGFTEVLCAVGLAALLCRLRNAPPEASSFRGVARLAAG